MCAGLILQSGSPFLRIVLALVLLLVVGCFECEDDDEDENDYRLPAFKSATLRFPRRRIKSCGPLRWTNVQIPTKMKDTWYASKEAQT